MTAAATTVGGLPVYFTASWTDPGSAAVTITTPTGFYPDLVLAIDNTGTNPNVYVWQKGGNANPGGIKMTGSTGVLTYVTTDGITVANGSVVLGTDVVDDNVTGTVHCFRYAQ